MTGECDSVGGVSQENSQEEGSLAGQPSPTVETSKLDVAQPTTEVEVAKIEKVSSSESPKGPKSKQAVERSPVHQPSTSTCLDGTPSQPSGSRRAMYNCAAISRFPIESIA